KFEGYMVTPERPLFLLSLDRKHPSDWLRIGQHFEDFAIVAFDAKSEELTVEKDGKRQILHLVDANSHRGGAPQPTKPIVISIAGGESISLGPDFVATDALRAKFAALAARDPQPAITLQMPDDMKVERVRAVFDFLRSAGLTRFNLRTDQ